MNSYKELFCLYATLTPHGIVSDIGGRLLEESKLNARNQIGKNFTEIVFWKDSENLQKIQSALRTAAEGKESGFEITLLKNVPIKAKITPMFDNEKKVEKINFLSIDVSEYVQEVEFYQKRCEQLLFAAESAGVGLWVWNVGDDKIFTTPLCNKLYGLPPDEQMTYQKFIQSIYPPDLKMVEGALQKSLGDLSDYKTEFRVQHNNGKKIWLSVQGRAFREDDNTTVMTGSVRDITHRKLSEEYLQVTKSQAEENSLQKDHFLAVISHELRSPLQTILGWSKILLSSQVDEATQRKALETIENSAKLQAKLISDLVDSAKIISGNLDFSVKSLDLSQLIDEVFQAQKPMADEKNISLVLGNIAKLTVEGDKVRLQQAITNLLTNAIKFTPADGVALIQLTERDGQAHLSITDSGPGITPEDLPFVFKQYFQSKTSKNKTGLGLGLSIVKAIVEKHKGEVMARNNDNGVGCTFSVTLPIYRNLEQTSAKPRIEAKDSSVPLKNIEILIVEDNYDSREVLDFYLTRLGAKIHSAASAQEGLSYLKSAASLPDVIISDISMPEEDGYSFIKKVRNLPDKSSIPAIALTAFASSNDEKKVLEAGFQKYHTKPFQPDLLVSDILSLVFQKS